MKEDKLMEYCVVIPSIRELPLEYLEPILDDVQVVVVDDTNGTAPRHDHPNILYCSHDFQDKYLPGAAEIIPRRNPSCKAFGLYYAWKEGWDVVVLLDDDCDTSVSPNFLEEIPIGRTIEAHRYMSPSGWYNTMLQLGETDIWPRGYPYEHRNEHCRILPTTAMVQPMFNEGLWTGTADINGIDKLNGDEATKNRDIFPDYVVVDIGGKIPLSIMNVQLHRDLIPAFYQPPDWELAKFKVRRHDDVWSMYALKVLMDKKGHVATVGRPLIWHRKEGDMYREILSEHLTNLVQGYLTQVIDDAVWSIPEGSYAEMAYALGEGMQRFGRTVPGYFSHIITDYGLRVSAWANLFL